MFYTVFAQRKKNYFKKVFIYVPINCTEPGKQAYQTGGAFSQATQMQVPEI